MTGAAAVPEGTHHAPHSATVVAYAILLPIFPIATCAMTPPTA